MAGLSPATMAIVILYKAVTDAPIVNTGTQEIINNKLTIIRLHSPVRNLVALLFGLKKEEAIVFSVYINIRNNIILNNSCVNNLNDRCRELSVFGNNQKNLIVLCECYKRSIGDFVQTDISDSKFMQFNLCESKNCTIYSIKAIFV